MLKFDVQLIGKCFGKGGGRMLWTPKLPYQIPDAVLQILPLVANLLGCRWDKFVLFIFLFSFVVYVICFCLSAYACMFKFIEYCLK